MELLKQLITRILGSGCFPPPCALVRAVTVLMVFCTLSGAAIPRLKGQRRKDRSSCWRMPPPAAFPLLYWEEFHWAQPQLRYSNTR